MIRKITNSKLIIVFLCAALLIHAITTILLTIYGKWTGKDSIALSVGILEIITVGALQTNYRKLTNSMLILNIVLIFIHGNVDFIPRLSERVDFIGMLILLVIISFRMRNSISGDPIKFVKIIYSLFVAFFGLGLFANGLLSYYQDSLTRIWMLEGLCLILLAILIWYKFFLVNIVVVIINIVIIVTAFFMNIYSVYPEEAVTSVLAIVIFIIIINSNWKILSKAINVLFMGLIITWLHAVIGQIGFFNDDSFGIIIIMWIIMNIVLIALLLFQNKRIGKTLAYLNILLIIIAKTIQFYFIAVDNQHIYALTDVMYILSAAISVYFILKFNKDKEISDIQ